MAVAPRQPRPSRRRLPLLAAATMLLLTAGIVAIAVSRGADRGLGTEVPAATGWSTFPAPPLEPRWDPVSIGTDDGWFVWGGIAPDAAAPANADGAHYDGAYYDGTTGEWRVVPEAPVTPDSAQLWSAAWTGTEVVMIQAYEQPQAVAFDPVAMSWRRIEVPEDVRAAWGGTGLIQTAWSDGRVTVVASGDPEVGRPVTASTLDPATGSWSRTVPAPGSLSGLVDQIVSTSTDVFAVAPSRRQTPGCTSDAVLLRFDVQALQWSETVLPDPTANPGFVAVADGRVLVGGGTACDAAWSPRTDAWAFTLDTGTWERIADVPSAVEYQRGDPVAVDGAAAITAPAGALLLFWPGPDTWSTVHFPLGPVDATFATFGGRLGAWGVGLPRPGPQDGTSTCCRPSPAAWVFVPSRPADGDPVDAPTSTVPGTYEIRVGDDAATVAARLCVTVEELSAVNGVATLYDAFVQGAQLAVPAPSIEGCTPELDPPVLPGYEVREGDTPAIVAARLCVTVDELAAVNAGLDARTRLLTTEGIAVPPPSVGACTPDTRPSFEVPPPPMTSPTTVVGVGTYSVVEGDNPQRVARKLCVTFDELTAANEDNEAYTRFLIGDQLVAPPPSIEACTPVTE